jgi:hypothetical protein
MLLSLLSMMVEFTMVFNAAEDTKNVPWEIK